MLWIRELDSIEPRVLPGTEDAAHPFWSPDGRSLAFLAGGRLKRVDVSRGGVLTLADTNTRMGGSWNRNDTILFAPRLNEFATVPATGGAVSPIPTRDGAGWPFFLPDGRHFLYLSRGRKDGNAIMIGSLDSKARKILVRAGSNAAVASGFLFYWQEVH